LGLQHDRTALLTTTKNLNANRREITLNVAVQPLTKPIAIGASGVAVRRDVVERRAKEMARAGADKVRSHKEAPMKLTNLLLPLLAVVLLAIVAGALALRIGKRKASGDLAAKKPLTEREQAMYFRLVSTFPEHVVLAQVAFSALLASKDRPTRSTFDRKVADFVLCQKDFTPVAVIELDDKSHRGKETSDAARDALLAKAGYRVQRFANVPDVAELATTMARLQSA
jgi:very-short-patch-repair endonuclease